MQIFAKLKNAQKKFHDRIAKEPTIQIGDRVYFICPKKSKFALPFSGPYRVMEVHPNGVILQHIEKPNSW